MLSSEHLKSKHEVPEYVIMTRDHEIGNHPLCYKHGTLFRLLEGVAGIGFLVAAGWTFYVELS